MLTLVAAAVSPAPGGAAARLRGLLLAGVLALAAFVVANPYALLDYDAFRDGLSHQSETVRRRRRQARPLDQDSGIVYYLGTITWGLGWLPALAALAGAIGLALRDRRLAARARARAASLPGLHGHPGPLLRPLAAAGLPAAVPARRVGGAWTAATGSAPACGGRPSPWSPARSARCCASRGSSSRSTTTSCWPAPTPASSRATGWSTTSRSAPRWWSSRSCRPRGRPTPRASRAGTGNGFRWNKWPTTRARKDPWAAASIRFEDYERITRPALLGAYARGGYCWVVTGSTQYGRAYAEPGAGAGGARATTRRSSATGSWSTRSTPYGSPERRVPFSFDFSFNAYPLDYDRMGPEIRIYRLRGGEC